MNSRVATITALIIGTLVAIVGVVPASRKAVVSVFRGEWRLRDLFVSGDVQNRSRRSEGGATSPDIGKTRPAGLESKRALGGDPQPRVGDRQAEDLLDRAIAMVERCPSIAAKTRQSVDLLGRRLVGAGEYLEQRAGAGRMFRLELRMQVGDEPRTLLHVCNGRFLWRCESYQGKGTAEYVDLERVSQAHDERGGSTQLGRMGQLPGLGGLPKLLRSLRDWFDFVSASETVLPDKTPVICLRGQWKSDRLAAFLPGLEEARRSGPPPNSDDLPKHLPHFALLFLGRDDLFPFRIEYRRRLPHTALRLDGQTESTMVTMDLYEVSLQVPFDPERFTFKPGNLECSNQTTHFVERLGFQKKP